MFRYLSGAEFETVMERAGSFEGETGPAGRNAIAFIMGLHGLRSEEICGLCVRDLDIGLGAVYVNTIKKGVPRAVHVEARIMTWLRRFAAGYPDAAPLLRTCRGRPLLTRHIRRSWRRLSMRWLGRYVRFHATRHTAAQRLSEATDSLLKVKKFLGHKTLTATLIYAEDVGDVREYMPRLPQQEFQPTLFQAG